MSSLATRVLLGTTAAVAASLVLAGVALYGLVERSLVAQLDHDLLAKGRLLASAVEQERGGLDLDAFHELDMSEFGEGGRSYLQLCELPGRDDDGRSLYSSRSISEKDCLLSGHGRDGETGWMGLADRSRVRYATIVFKPRREHGRTSDEDASLILRIARDGGELQATLATLRNVLLAVGAGTLVLAGAVLALVVRRSLRPLAAVSTRIASIGERDLSVRLETLGVPSEMLPVVERVNELLARLEQAFARERSFSNDVAHELRTPLAGLRTTLEVTGQRERTPEEYARTLGASMAVVGQLQAMVDRLLQLARLEGGGAATKAERIDVADLLLEVWEPLAGDAAARRLHVEWSLAEGLSADADRELLRLVARNLLENAVAYADDGGRIGITGSSDPRGVTLVIRNSGSQLSPDDVAKATQRFWRGDAARTDAGQHCGLGLALVEKAIERLAATLELASEDGWFTARVTLPGDGTIAAPVPSPGEVLVRS